VIPAIGCKADDCNLELEITTANITTIKLRENNRIIRSDRPVRQSSHKIAR
jgi:hypothetical protein